MEKALRFEFIASGKYELVKRILNALPTWFGIADALEEYAVQSSTMPVLVCYKGEEIIGFVALKKTSDVVMEHYVLGVLPSYHRKGIGKALLKAAEVHCQTQGYKFMQVKTVAPCANNASYLKTYAFYKAMGYENVEVLPLWDEHNPCLLMIKVL